MHCFKIIHLLPLMTVSLSAASAGGATSLPDLAGGSLVRWAEFGTGEVARRNIDIWLPDGYTPERRYPVLYMHDGQMLFDGRTTWNGQEWKVDETMGRLIESGRVPPAIVVGIWNSGAGRYTDYFPRRVFETIPEGFLARLREQAVAQGRGAVEIAHLRSDAYLRFLVEELKPAIDAAFATLPDRAHTFVAGSSMGGLISLYAICEYPEVFGGAACLSTHWIGVWDDLDNPIPEAFAAYLRDHLPEPGAHRFYFDHGTETLDRWYARGQALVDAVMAESGYTDDDWRTRVFEGTDHSEQAWSERLHVPLEFLLGSIEAGE
jgi:enterochelin esterase-like enzyme